MNVLYSSIVANGELDLLVLNNLTQKVEEIYEVKCRKNIRQAVSKAEEQLKRFSDTLLSQRSFFSSLDLVSWGDVFFQFKGSCHLDLANFSNPITYKVISYKDNLAKELGFLELDQTLEQIHLLKESHLY